MSAHRKPPPPPRPRKSQQLNTINAVRALYSYQGRTESELSFEEGDMIIILDKSDSQWWKAKCKGRTGYVPYNYMSESTEEIDWPLHESCKRGNIDTVIECIKAGASVNSLDKAGNTPLHWAARGGHVECLQQILEQDNVILNHKNHLGDTPLHLACWKGSGDAVKLLLSEGVDSNILNEDKKLPRDLATDVGVTAAFLEHSNINQASDGDAQDSDN